MEIDPVNLLRWCLLMVCIAGFVINALAISEIKEELDHTRSGLHRLRKRVQALPSERRARKARGSIARRDKLSGAGDE